MWWSSKASHDPNTDEVLLYAMVRPDTLVTSVSVRPLRDPYNSVTCYTWKNVILTAYRLDVKDRLKEPKIERACTAVNLARDSESGQTIGRLLSEQTPVFRSSIYGTPQPKCDDWQHYRLPMGVVANLVTITLIGKNSRQFPDSGYFVCVSNVSVRGIPLYESNDSKDNKEIAILQDGTEGSSSI